MRLSEVLDVVYSSQPDDWVEVSRGGNGPVYKDKFIASTSGQDSYVQLDVVSHYGYAVYEPDVDLTIAWGIDPHAFGSMERSGSLAFEWAKFPDPEVSAFLVDIFYRGALIHRSWMLHVDGGRHVVPMPDRDGTGEYFSQRTLALGRIVAHRDGNGGREFDATIRTTGLPIR